MDKICPICDKRFQTKRKDAICCSKNCGSKLWGRNNKDKIREKKKRYAKTEKYKEAQKIRWEKWYDKYHRGNKKIYEKKCKYCEIIFISNRSDKIYCSHECANKYWKKQNKEHIKEYNEINKEKKNRQNKEWKINNPEKRLNQKHKRRALMKEHSYWKD